jgi:Type III secretion system lipoprotein chaperone (YscW)
MILQVAVAVAVLGLAACGLAESTPSVVPVDGTLIYFERLALPPSAIVDVELRDTARVDAPARTLGTQRIPASQDPPFPFALRVPATASPAPMPWSTRRGCTGSSESATTVPAALVPGTRSPRAMSDRRPWARRRNYAE